MISTLRSSTILTKLSINIWSKTSNLKYKFCTNLPKPSRFLEDVGLHKQFQQLTASVSEGQKSLNKIYQFMLWTFLCMLGTVAAGAFIKQQFRSRLLIYYDYFLLTLLPNSNQRNIKCLKDVIAHQTQYFTHRIFSDRFTAHIINHCIDHSFDLKLQKQQKAKYQELIDDALFRNFKNIKNKLNSYSLYKKYLQQIYTQKNYKQSQMMDKIITKLFKNGDLQSIYLIVLLKQNNIISLTKSQKQLCKLTVSKLEIENLQYQEKIDQAKKIDQTLFVEPYEFDCKLKKKWIIFIQNNL